MLNQTLHEENLQEKCLLRSHIESRTAVSNSVPDKQQPCRVWIQPELKPPGARFSKEVQPTRSLNLNSELSYSEMRNSEFSVTEQLNCVSLLNSK